MGFSQDVLRTARDFGSPPERKCSFVCPDRRNWLRAGPARSITGSKRRIRETSFCYSIERLFRSRHLEGPSKKLLRQLVHQIHHYSHTACSSDSKIRKPRPDSVGKDCDNPKTSASKSWSFSFPAMSYLPPPDGELFEEYSVCDHGGLMCAEVSKSPKKGELVVFNPLTGETRALPPLLHPRNPVSVHLSVDSAKRSYKVIMAGSSAASDEHLSKKVEVFESSTSKWKEVCDLPGSAFGLNEHQSGVFLNGKLFLISFLESGRRGVVALDVENGTWLQDLTVPFPWSSSNTVQLVESDGKLFLFSEQETDQSVDHCIDELEFPDLEAGLLTSRWRSFVKVKESGGQLYPEHTCFGFGEEKLGILRKKLRYIVLLLCMANVPNGACAQDQSIQDSLSSNLIPSIAWESLDFAKTVAGTLLAGLMVIGAARFAWGIFRRRQAPGNRFDIMQGLEDSNIPARGNPLFAILPDIPA